MTAWDGTDVTIPDARRLVLLVGTIAFTSLSAAAASAQRGERQPAATPAGFVRIDVADTAHTPLADVILAVLDSADNALFVTRTDSHGLSVFGLETAGRKHLVVRKIGFLETRRLLRVRAGDTLRVSLVLSHVPPQLDTVRITARRRSDDYFIDARMIAGIQHHYVKDAYDAMRAINPSMLGDGARDCRPVRNLWVDDRRVLFSPSPSYDLPVSSSPSAPVIPMDAWGGIPSAGAAHAPPSSVFAIIRAAHIATIVYRNCWDGTVPGRGGRNAIFITLKPGIVFDWKHGSYPADSLPDRRR